MQVRRPPAPHLKRGACIACALLNCCAVAETKMLGVTSVAMKLSENNRWLWQ